MVNLVFPDVLTIPVGCYNFTPATQARAYLLQNLSKQSNLVTVPCGNRSQEISGCGAEGEIR